MVLISEAIYCQDLHWVENAGSKEQVELVGEVQEQLEYALLDTQPSSTLDSGAACKPLISTNHIG